MVREYMAHCVIDTPAQRPAEFLRASVQLARHWKSPDRRERYLEPFRVLELMRRLITDGMNCIDVGCHLGSMLSKMRRLSPSGRHIAVEPIPHKADWLRRKFPDVDVRQLALADTSGEADFSYFPRRSALSRLRLGNSPESSWSHFKVQCARLDDLIASDTHVDFLKLDVEGAELLVLRGAERLLHRSRPAILFECTQSGLDAFGIAASDLFALLTKHHSYTLFHISDWLADGKALTATELEDAIRPPVQAVNFLAVCNSGRPLVPG